MRRPGCRERSSQHGAGGDGALTVVSSPVATWTGTSSRWFRDSCPPTSTCSWCEYPGGVRTPDLPRRAGGPSASDPWLQLCWNSLQTPLMAVSGFCFVFNFSLLPSGTSVHRAVLPPSGHYLELHCSTCNSQQPPKLIIIVNAGPLCKGRRQAEAEGYGKFLSPT